MVVALCGFWSREIWFDFLLLSSLTFVSHGSAKPIQTPSSSVTGMTVLIQPITQLKDLGITNDDLRLSDSKICGKNSIHYIAIPL